MSTKNRDIFRHYISFCILKFLKNSVLYLFSHNISFLKSTKN